MILVLGGTSESRSLLELLVSRGYQVLVSTATPYGASLVEGGGAEVLTGRLGKEDLLQLLVARGVNAVVDISHPFAKALSDNARWACSEGRVKYIRYKRKDRPLDENPLVHPVDSYQEASLLAAALGETIFLATGSKTAGIFIEASKKAGRRLVLRVLPDPQVLAGLLAKGVSPGDIVALRGPFSYDLNLALLKHYQASVLVTKESGAEGGQDQKLAAALSLNIPAVIVRRPPEPEGAVDNFESVLKELFAYY